MIAMQPVKLTGKSAFNTAGEATSWKIALYLMIGERRKTAASYTTSKRFKEATIVSFSQHKR